MSELIDKVAKERYLRGDEKAMDDVYERVAVAVGENVKVQNGPTSNSTSDMTTTQLHNAWSIRFFNLMCDGVFLPNSPTLMNAGTDNEMLSACFGLPVNDSFEGPGGIYDSLINSARIFKMGGGVGYNFSDLRGKGARVQSTDGVASGPVSFMRLYDANVGVIKQGGRRRGAAIGILNVDHPDIREFITCKSKEGDISNFNISVMLTDVFMEHINDVAGKEIFDMIVDGIHAVGEPGVLFYDNMNIDNPNKHIYDIHTTNPCVVGETLLLTNKGYVPIKDVAGRDVLAWNGFEWSLITPSITGYDQELMEIEFSDGTSLICTPYHGFKTWVGYSKTGNEVEKEARELVIGDRLSKCTYPVIEGDKELEHAYTHGFFSGDGCHENRDNIDTIYLYGKKRELLPHLHYIGINNNNNKRTVIRLDASNGYKKEFVPDASYSVNSRLKWLAGLIDSDGTKVNMGISICSVNKTFLMNVKYMLNTVGCRSTVALISDEKMKFMPDGNGGLKEYKCQPCYMISIPGIDIMNLNTNGIETHRIDVSNITIECDRTRFVTVKSIKHLDYTDTVYCANEPKNHTLIFNGVYTSQCGEIGIGVNPKSGGGEACNLGSINVAKCVNEKYPSNFDWKMLADITRDAVVFLDTIIDMNEYPTEAIGDMTKSTRKIGLGLMGLHDALIMMEYAYNSHEGRMIAKDIMNSINRAAQETSKKLGIELGCYPAWKGSEWEKMGIPMRNSTLTCIAPTGTISILAGCSSGIEPYYNWVYERDNTMGGKYFICVPIFEEMINRLVNEMSPVDIKKNLYEYYNVVVFDTGDSDEWYIQNSDDTEYFGDIREKFIDCIKQDCFEKGTIQHMKFIPEKTRKVFVNALDISPEDHIKMQAELQAYCDNSISKTVNMPNSATKEDVADAIKLAWELGCKGFTMYREGSRKNVVLKLKDKPEPFVRVDGVDITPAVKDFTVTVHKPIPMQSETKRVLPSTRYKVQSGCGELYIHVAEDNEKIREVFVECGGSGGCAANNNAIGRLISLGLKHNVPIAAIIRQLKKVKCDACIRNSNAEGKSCADIIGKVLEESSPVDEDITSIKYNITPPVGKTYMSTVTEDGFICPECQSTVIFEGRCFTCPNCGFSKCG